MLNHSSEYIYVIRKKGFTLKNLILLTNIKRKRLRNQDMLREERKGKEICTYCYEAKCQRNLERGNAKSPETHGLVVFKESPVAPFYPMPGLLRLTLRVFKVSTFLSHLLLHPQFSDFVWMHKRCGKDFVNVTSRVESRCC